MEDAVNSGIIVRHTNLNSKCWVVRPGSRYRFITNFLDLGCVAMAHLDDIYPDDSQIAALQAAEGDSIYEICEEIDSSLTTNTRGQVLSFIRDMAVGDVVFTLSGENVYPGIITSDPYIQTDGFSEKERFSVRRTVNWGDPIERKHIPVTLTKSFQAYQAVFSLGNNSKEIHHWLSAFFVSNQTYYSSLRVNQAGDLSHHSLKNLSEIMDRLQVLSLMIGNGSVASGDLAINLDDLLENMRSLDASGKLVLTSQQVVMSPGDLWYGFKAESKRSGVAFLVGAAMLFNQSIAFADPELEQVRQEIAPIVMVNIPTIKENADLNAIQKALWVKPSGQNRAFVDQASEQPSQANQLPRDGSPRHSTR